jgi:hypothetical protein
VDSKVEADLRLDFKEAKEVIEVISALRVEAD